MPKKTIEQNMNMTQEEKQLLLKDFCGRLPYGVIYHRNDGANIELHEADIKNGTLNYTDKIVEMECKPYLRPISNITEEETKQLNYILPCSMSFTYTTSEELIIYTDSEYDGDHDFSCFVEIQDWLNKHHFDFRGLIEKGLALEATEDIYKSE